MPDGHNRPNEVTSSTNSRRPLGSQVIRERVDQLLHSSSVPPSLHPPAHNFHSSSHASNRGSLADGHSKPQIELASAHERRKRPYSTSYPSSSHRVENRPIPSTVTPSAVPSHTQSYRPSSSIQYTLSSESEPSSFLAPKRKEIPPARLSKAIPGNSIDMQHSNLTERDEPRRTIQKEPFFTGPLAVAEFGRLKQEIETLKGALHEHKKLTKRDKKKLEECQTELSTALSKIQEQDKEISTLRANHKKAEETLSAVEHSIQCQICMELPDNPFALSPCGHILCLTCLQEWFKKAPPALEDADIDPEELSDPHYILMRSKSCPSCRARVKRRPVPVFMVKAVTFALKNAKETSTDLGNDTGFNMTDDDPWNGIFPSSDEDEGSDEHEDDSDLNSDEENEVLLSWYPEDNDDDDDSAGTGSEDDDTPVRQVYVAPSWEPPRAVNQASQYLTRSHDIPNEMLKLLLRGCTLDMISSFTLFYHHVWGISLLLPGNPLDSSDDDSDDELDANIVNYIYLGWNITLAPDDRDGERFVEDVLRDIRNNPAGWKVSQRRGHLRGFDATRLVKVDEVEDYDTTDTEIWIDAED